MSGHEGRQRRPGTILMYHRIATEPTDPFRLCVTPDVFDAHLTWISAHATPLALADYVAAVLADDLPDRAVVVTLDDGYRDNLETASPLLLRHGVPATFFVTTVGLDEPREYWWDTLTRWLCEEPSLPSALEFETPAGITSVDTEDRRAALATLHAGVRLLGAADQRASMARLERAVCPATTPGVTALDGGGLRDLASRPGHEIGAHTRHHLSLPSHPNAVQRDELHGCRRLLEELLDKPVPFVAYPYGEVNETTSRLSAEAGFTAGLAGADRLPSAGLLPVLPRVDVTALDADVPSWLRARFAEGERP